MFNNLREICGESPRQISTKFKSRLNVIKAKKPDALGKVMVMPKDDFFIDL